MTNHTEQLLRDVFAEQAERAPSGGPILAVLDRPSARSRRPMKRTLTPWRARSGSSRSIVSTKISIRSSTSFAGRDQFSVEKA